MGRSKEDFRKFFAEYDLSLLSEVKAVAMDMLRGYRGANMPVETAITAII